MTRRMTIPLVTLLVLTAIATALLVSRGPGRKKQVNRAPVPLDISDIPVESSVWVDVHRPAKVWEALRSNAWLARVANEPIGRGMSTGWTGFLSTRGSDVSDAFRGMVLDVVTDKLLADPFRVVFFAGPSATGTPAIVVPKSSSAATSAYDLVEGFALNGSYSAGHCPGQHPAAGQAKPSPAMVISRWLIAEHAVFAAHVGDRIVLARSPVAAVQALCTPVAEVPTARDIDVSISFSPRALGREAELAATLLGLGQAPRFALAVEGNRFEPRGILGTLDEPDRLDAAPPPADLLKLIPADAGVVVLATLRLPANLTRDTLRKHLDRSYHGAYSPRPVAVIWNPRGSETLPTELAVAWPDRDCGLLAEAFTGPNRMRRRRECRHEVLASTDALGQSVQRSCEGKAPSLLNVSPSVAEGLRRPVSFEVGANLGILLSRLLEDAWMKDASSRGTASSEIEAARRLLEELPFFGLGGVAAGSSLVPGGFRS
ncbi:MAG TPA: hypothetical protein VMK12_02725 [Anaeromyxobacteraceae bacterium]|nr:hypothetical protein [Anaeromyxobacteraceae bacterium]